MSQVSPVRLFANSLWYWPLSGITLDNKSIVLLFNDFSSTGYAVDRDVATNFISAGKPYESVTRCDDIAARYSDARQHGLPHFPFIMRYPLSITELSCNIHNYDRFIRDDKFLNLLEDVSTKTLIF